MSDNIRTFSISYESDLGPILKDFAHNMDQATTAVDRYRQVIRRSDTAQTRLPNTYRVARQTTAQQIPENKGKALSPIESSLPFTVASVLAELGKSLPHIRHLAKAVSTVLSLLGPLTVTGKTLDGHIQPRRPTDDVNARVIDGLDKIDKSLVWGNFFSALASIAKPYVARAAVAAAPVLASKFVLPLLSVLGAASVPLLVATVGVAGLAYIAKRRSDKEEVRRRESAALAEGRRRTAPQYTKMKLEDYALGRENSLRTAYEWLRLSNQSIVNLTGQNVDDLLKGLQDLNPRALESYFQSLREGRGEIEQLSQTQLAHIDLIEKLVVTYRALAVESDAARDAASEYADHLRPVDVIFETLTVHAGALTAQFVEQHGALQRQTQATEAQAQAARDVAAATTAQAAATERANTGEAARTRNLLRTTQHTRAASGQIASATERLTDLTGALVTTDAGLATHSEHVGYVTEAYRELSAQIGDTIGDVLSGAVSFKEAWESLGRGVLDTVKHLGRQLLDSLLGSVRDVGRRLADVIFGQVQGALGSFELGGSR